MLQNSQRLVERAFRALAPGGQLLITSPNIYSLRARVRFLLNTGVPFFKQAAHSIPTDPDHIHPIVLEAYQRKIFTPCLDCLSFVFGLILTAAVTVRDGLLDLLRIRCGWCYLIIYQETPSACYFVNWSKGQTKTPALSNSVHLSSN